MTAQAEEIIYLDAKLVAEPDGTVPVAWCVEEPLTAQIRERGFVDPHVVIVVRSVGSERIGSAELSAYTDTSTQVVPLKTGLAYVSFTRPGRNEVCLTVVDVNDKGTAGLLSGLRKQTSRKPRTDSLFTDEGKPRTWSEESSRVFWHIPFIAQASVTLPIEVSRDNFAAEPAEWRRRLVSRYFKSKGVDECGFRRRFWFGAIPITPFYVAGSFLGKIGVLLLAAIFGTRDTLKLFPSFLHAFESPVKAIDRVEDDTSIWFTKKDEYGRHSSRGPWCWVLNPIVLTVPALFVWMIFNFRVHYTGSKATHPVVAWGFWKTVVVVDGTLLAALVVGVLAALLFLALAKGGEAATGWLKGRTRSTRSTTRRQRRYDEAVAKQKAQAIRNAEALACGQVPIAHGVRDLPLRRMTPRLVYQATKRQVCRPFAR